MILEYLGGIETTYNYHEKTNSNLILEYLGGIETMEEELPLHSFRRDFRIPRRD